MLSVANEKIAVAPRERCVLNYRPACQAAYFIRCYSVPVSSPVPGCLSRR